MLLLLACRGEPLDVSWCEDTPAVAPDVTPTWSETISPLLEARCVRCHQEGGPGGFALDDYDTAVANAAAIQRAVADRTMPPWLAAGCCADYADDFSLTPEEIGAIYTWVEAGTPEGTENGPEIDATGGLSRVDLTLTMEPYTPTGTADDLRCFVLDWPDDAPRYITGLEPRPGARAIVHHLIVSAVAPGDADRADEADAADPGPGFDCSAGLGQLGVLVTPLGGSLQGGDYPRGIGTPVAAGSRILLQVHYYVGEGATEDQTALDFRLDDVAVEASGIVIANAAWLAGEAMRVPAGETDVAFTYQFKPLLFTGGVPVDLQGVTPHLHRWARRIRVLRVTTDGATECLLEISEWDFGWEQPYWFLDPIRFDPADELYLECTFDNPKDSDIAWGEDDQDMCVAFLSFTVAE